jgi:hypothetical protein
MCQNSCNSIHDSGGYLTFVSLLRLQFALVAEEFIVITGADMEKDLRVLMGLSRTVTTLHSFEYDDEGVYDGFVTVPDVDSHFGAARESIGATIVSYVPRINMATHQAWINYSTSHQAWILDANDVSTGNFDPIVEHIFTPSSLVDDDDKIIPPGTRNKLGPVWQFVPPPSLDDTSAINQDMMSVSSFANGRDYVDRSGKATLLDTQRFSHFYNKSFVVDAPETAILFPVRSTLKDDAEITGDLMVVMPWLVLLDGILISSTPPIHVVISNSCNQIMTFEVEGQTASYLGEGDLHDPNYSFLVAEDFFASFENSDLLLDNELDDHCVYFKSVYPTKQFEESQRTNMPLMMALAILCVSVLIVLAFIAFDCLVSNRQNRLMKTAKKQHALVASLFPKSIQKKLMEEVEEEMKAGKKLSSFGKAGLRSYLDEEGRENEATNTKPIADLFPETTVMFADIAGENKLQYLPCLICWTMNSDRHICFNLFACRLYCMGFNQRAKPGFHIVRNNIQRI